MVTFAILEGGLTELPQEFKQRRVRGWMREIRRKLGENLLGIDYETSVIWGQILTSARRRRLKLPYHDSLIAATAKRHELVVMTRNIGFFAPFSIEIFNPWAEKQDSAYDFGEEPAESFSRPGSTSAELSLPRGNAGSISESLDSENEAA
jgi:predicted nucleic acid-binding protein